MILKTLPLIAALVLADGCAKPSYGYGGGGGDGDVGGVRTTSAQSIRHGYWRGSRYRASDRAPASPAPISRRMRVAEEAEAPSTGTASGGLAGTAMPRRMGPGASPPTEPSPDSPADGQAAAGQAGGKEASGPAVATENPAPQTRMILYRGTLMLQVIQLNDAMEAAQKLALGMGAYLQSRANNQLTFRVPVEKFQPLLKALEAIGEVASKSIHADDVTQQYYDIEVRLKAAETILARLKALLAQAKNVEESLAIEKEMGRLLETIERYKGTLRYLQHHASLSTLTLIFQVKPLYSQPIQSQWRSPFHWVQGLGLWRMMSH